MSVESARRSRAGGNASWSSAAFIVESILLLAFLAASLAILTCTFALSLNRSAEGRALEAAAIGAANVAERFADDPTGVSTRTEADGLVITCNVTSEPRTGGTMHRAQISVYADGAEEPVYALSTARYVSDGEGGGAR